jgi:hypothetical protein
MMKNDFFGIAGSAAGVAGLSIALILIIFRDTIRKNIFPRLSKVQAYNIIRLIVILSTFIAVVGIIAWLVKIPLDKIDTIQPAGHNQPLVTKLPVNRLNPKIVDVAIEGIGDVTLTGCNSMAPCGPVRPGARLHVEMNANGFAALFVQDNRSLFHLSQDRPFIRNLKMGDILLDTMMIRSGLNRFYIVTSARDFNLDAAGWLNELPGGTVWGPAYIEMKARRIERTAIKKPHLEKPSSVFDSIYITLPKVDEDPEITVNGLSFEPQQGKNGKKFILVNQYDSLRRLVVKWKCDSCISMLYPGTTKVQPCAEKVLHSCQ